MSKQPKKQSVAATELGRLGGKALFKKRGKAYMKKLSKKATKAHWGK